jgi:hypothetical protein
MAEPIVGHILICETEQLRVFLFRPRPAYSHVHGMQTDLRSWSSAGLCGPLQAPVNILAQEARGTASQIGVKGSRPPVSHAATLSK